MRSEAKRSNVVEECQINATRSEFQATCQASGLKCAALYGQNHKPFLPGYPQGKTLCSWAEHLGSLPLWPDYIYTDNKEHTGSMPFKRGLCY